MENKMYLVEGLHRNVLNRNNTILRFTPSRRAAVVQNKNAYNY